MADKCTVCNEEDFSPREVVRHYKTGMPLSCIDMIINELKCCFTCAFWTEKVRGGAHYTIIEGTSYVIKPKAPPGVPNHCLGFGGSLFKVKYLSDGRIVESNNVWCQGLIPERFRSQLPDTAEFVRDEVKA